VVALFPRKTQYYQATLLAAGVFTCIAPDAEKWWHNSSTQNNAGNTNDIPKNRKHAGSNQAGQRYRFNAEAKA